MSTTTRKGGCGCGGKTHTHNGGGNGGCGCKPAQPCGCQDHGTRVVLGDCNCEGPVRCGVPCLERPAFSAGQLLTADSLRLGQKYFEDKFALRRFVDGVGVVCGLHVRCDPEENGWVIVDPGYAIDCCGNDIVLCEPVRFNVCKAIDSCVKPEAPCEEVVDQAPPPPAPPPQAAQPVAEGDHWLPDRVVPGGIDTSNTKPYTIGGNVIDANTQQPLASVRVKIDGTNVESITDAGGNFAIRTQPQAPGPNNIVVVFSLVGYRNTKVKIQIGSGQTDRIANVPLFPPTAEPPQPPEPPGEFHTYVLRVERIWQGCAPTAVVVNRAGCDPRPESRPSKEVGSVRLCVSKFNESSTATRVRDRTNAFRQAGMQLQQRIARALEIAEGIQPNAEKDPNPRGRLVADAMLAMLREEPARSSCNLYDLICDIRRLITNGTPQCFGFPQSVIDNPELALVGAFGQLMDDFREIYLTRDCDDCCEQVGVRVAHIITQDQLPICAPRGCSIAAIDTHAPARETLHPRSAWYHPDQVAVYDAYFLGFNEAGVLLTDRGLTVNERDANTNTDRPTDFQTVWAWVEDSVPSELGRYELYQTSVLYVDFGSTVTLWTVGGRVVAITTESARKILIGKTWGRSSRIAYLKHSMAPLMVASGPAVVNSMSGRDVSVHVREPRAAAAPVKAIATPAETTAILSQLDPAPFRDIIWGIGAKTETAFYMRGINTLADLIAAPDIDLAEMMRIGEIEYVKAQAKDILSGKISFSADELLQWGAAARLRKAKIERSIA